MKGLNILHYKQLPNGRWEAYDYQGRSAIGQNKYDAKRLFYIYYQMPHEVNGYTRHGLIPTEQLTLDKN